MIVTIICYVVIHHKIIPKNMKYIIIELCLFFNSICNKIIHSKKLKKFKGKDSCCLM